MKKFFIWGAVTCLALWNLCNPNALHAQAIFQNNDTSCEEHTIIGEFDSIAGNIFLDSSITCGRFNDDSSVIDPTHGGNPDFPDCATQADAFVESPVSPQVSNSILTNTAAHGDNCLNAGGANPQFQTPDFLSLLDFEEQRMGSIAHGNLNGGAFDDLVMVEAGDPGDTTSSRALGFLFSQATGGFGTPTDVSGVAQLEPSLPIPYQTFVGMLFAGDENDALEAQSALVLQDCNGDGFDDAIVTVKEVGDSQAIGIMVVQNDGTGLVDNPAPVFFPLPSSVIGATDEILSIPLVQGNFNGDDIPDLVAAIADLNMATPTRSVALCTGNGNCTFNCPAASDPNDLILSGNFTWFSATSGDFDGDGLTDVALPEIGNIGMAIGQMRYLLSSGGTLDTWDQQVVSTTPPSVGTNGVFIVTSGRFTTAAIQNGIDEVVGSSADNVGGTVGLTVMPSDGAGGFGTPRILTFANPLPSTAPFGGIEAADFDNCGGDDVMAIAQAVDPVAVQAVVFLNENEAPVVAIDPNVPTQLVINTPLAIPTTCADPTNDDRTFQWTVVNQPVGATVIFGTPSGSLIGSQDDASTTFAANQVGDYLLQIDCTDFCGLSDQDVTQIQLPITVTFPLTQGDNLFHCELNQGGQDAGRPGGWGMVLFASGLFILGSTRLRRGNP